MKVKIIRDEIPDKFTGLKTGVIEFNGNKIIPWYINVLGITSYPDKLVFRMGGKYQTIITADYDEKKGKRNDKLWIMDIDVEPHPELKEKIM